MKKVLLLLMCISFCYSAISQNVIQVGDMIVRNDNMEKSKVFLEKNGFIIEPIEGLLGVDQDLRISASNGNDALSPVFCTIEAMSKQDRRIFQIKFICKSISHSTLRNSLQNLSYSLIQNGSYKEHTFTIPCSLYKKENFYCRISWFDEGAMVEFQMDRIN